MTVLQLIKAAMRKAQVIEKGEEPDSGEVQDALEVLSTMLKSWGARRLMIRATTPESFALVAGQYSYTIGVGGDFNTVKPYDIKSAFIRDSNNVDTDIAVVTRDLYDSMQDKAISTARPTMLCYDPGAAQQAVQTGTVLLYNIPDNTDSYTLHIDSQKPFTALTTLTEDVTFEDPYEEAIIYELSIRLWREYHKTPVPDDLVVLANEAMHTVETMNQVRLTAATDLPGVKGGSYNIYTGGYNG